MEPYAVVYDGEVLIAYAISETGFLSLRKPGNPAYYCSAHVLEAKKIDYEQAIKIPSFKKSVDEALNSRALVSLGCSHHKREA